MSSTIKDFSSLLPYLSGKVGCSPRRIVLGIAGHIATTELLHGHVLHVEANVVAGHGFGESLVVHLHRLYFGDQVDRRKVDDHA